MRAAGTLAVALVLGLGACTDDGGGAQAGSPTTPSTAPTPTLTGDGSAFCDAMLAIGQVGGAAGATPAQVLEATQELVGHLDEAQANTPSDAPPDFEALLDDYRLATEAIFDAEGDVSAAFAALEEDHPEVVARLGSSTSHEEAYDFLIERCGNDVAP
jgi:hypothetical protein